MLSFQNCVKAPMASNSLELPSTAPTPIPIDHPEEKTATPSYQTALILNKNQAADLLKSIFLKPGVNFGEFDSLIHQWILYKTGEFGGACNVYDSYGATDCGGGLSNVNLPYYASGNPLRESNRLQFCQRILVYDVAIENALFNVGLQKTDELTKNNISLVYELFYRGEDFQSADSQKVLSALDELNQSLKLEGENSTERWRAVLLTVCESAGWQLF